MNQIATMQIFRIAFYVDRSGWEWHRSRGQEAEYGSREDARAEAERQAAFDLLDRRQCPFVLVEGPPFSLPAVAPQGTGLITLKRAPFKPSKIEIRKTAGGTFIVLAEGRSSGELCFDEMLGTIIGLTVREGFGGYTMRTREEVEALERHNGRRIDPTNTEALAELEARVAQRLAEDFPS